jgi:hypothetical protein
VLQIALKLCESEVVSAIGSFRFQVDNIDLRAPKVIGFDAYTDTAEKKKFKLMNSPAAKKNKLAGLFIEKKEVVDKGKKELDNGINGNGIEGPFFLEPGLNGVRTCIRYLSRRDGKELPSFLIKTPLKSFEFHIPVIWQMNKSSRMYEDRVFNTLNNERDCIWGDCDSKECLISFKSFNEQHLETYNDPEFINHLNKIQKILNKVAPGRIELRLKIENLGEQLDLIELGILNRNEQGYYPVDDKTFQEALDRFDRELINRSQEETRRIMQRIDDDIAKYKELEREGKPKAKEKFERLKGLKNVMEAIESFASLEEETN